MKRKLKMPRLSRKGRVVRNLLVCLALLAVLWARYGYPLPTYEMNFRRMERLYMLPQGEVVFRRGTWLGGYWFVDEAGNQAVCGFVDSLSRPYTRSWQDLWVCPIAQEPSPVPLDERRLAVLHVPEETARAELELFGELLCEPAGPVEGQDAGDGVWYFEDLDGVRRVEEDGVVQNTDQLDGCAYTLKLYGADGGLLQSLEGTIPQTVHRTWLD